MGFGSVPWEALFWKIRVDPRESDGGDKGSPGAGLKELREREAPAPPGL